MVSCGREVKNASGSAGDPVKGTGVRGVRLSDVIVTGRQKVEVSEVKRVKASWSSEETGSFVSDKLKVNGLAEDLLLYCHAAQHT